MIEQVENMPGWTTSPDYFERCYTTGDTEFPRVRVRFKPLQVDPGNAAQMNVAAAPIAVIVAIWISLVGEDGTTLLAGNRAMVRECGAISYQQQTTAVFDPDAWLLEAMNREIPLVVAWGKGLQQAASLGLIAAPGASTSGGSLAPIILSDEQAALSRPPAENPPP